MNDTREFHLGDILSVTTGRLLSPNGMDGIYNILGFMTAEDLYTHQLPRVSDECKPYLLMEMPWLKEIDDSEVTTENWKQWLDALVEKHGAFHTVRRIHPEDHRHIHPLTELEQMVDPSKIIIMPVEDEEL